MHSNNAKVSRCRKYTGYPSGATILVVGPRQNGTCTSAFSGIMSVAFARDEVTFLNREENANLNALIKNKNKIKKTSTINSYRTPERTGSALRVEGRRFRNVGDVRAVCGQVGTRISTKSDLCLRTKFLHKLWRNPRRKTVPALFDG